MIWALTMTVALSTPAGPIGGKTGFEQHLGSLQAQFGVAPTAAVALRLTQGYGRVGALAQIRRWSGEARRLGAAPARAALVEGLAYLFAGHYEGAVVSLYDACTRSPYNGAAHVALWRAVTEADLIPMTVDMGLIRRLLLKRGYFVSAKRAPHPDARAARTHSDAGHAALHAGRFDEAIGHFERALSVHRGYAEAYRGLGAARARRNRKVKALAAHRLYLHLAKGDTRQIRRVRRQVADAERHRGLKASSARR